MTSPLALSLHERLADYLAGDSSLDEFKDWLVGATWSIDEAADPAGMQLADEVKLALADESGGFLTEAELREELKPFVTRRHATVRLTNDQTTALPTEMGTASRTTGPLCPNGHRLIQHT